MKLKNYEAILFTPLGPLPRHRDDAILSVRERILDERFRSITHFERAVEGVVDEILTGT